MLAWSRDTSNVKSATPLVMMVPALKSFLKLKITKVSERLTKSSLLLMVLWSLVVIWVLKSQPKRYYFWPFIPPSRNVRVMITEFRSSLPKKWSLADVMLLVSQLSVPPKCWNQWFPSQDQPVPKSPMLPTPFSMVLTVLCFQEKISKFSILPSLGGNHNIIILWSLKRWNCQGRIPSWIRLYHVKDCPRCRRCSFQPTSKFAHWSMSPPHVQIYYYHILVLQRPQIYHWYHQGLVWSYRRLCCRSLIQM